MWEAVAVAGAWGDCLAWSGGLPGDVAPLSRLAACASQMARTEGRREKYSWASMELEDGRTMYAAGSDKVICWLLGRKASTREGEAQVHCQAILEAVESIPGWHDKISQLYGDAAQKTDSYAFQSAMSGPPSSARPVTLAILETFRDRILCRLLGKTSWSELLESFPRSQAWSFCALFDTDLCLVLGHCPQAAPPPIMLDGFLSVFRACCLHRDLETLHLCYPDDCAALLACLKLLPQGQVKDLSHSSLLGVRVGKYLLVVSEVVEVSDLVYKGEEWHAFLDRVADFLKV